MGPNERMSDGSQSETKLDGKERSFSETMERAAEKSHRLFEGNCKVRLPALAPPCLAAGCSPAQCLCQRKPELKKPHSY